VKKSTIVDTNGDRQGAFKVHRAGKGGESKGCRLPFRWGHGLRVMKN
jgi:hypothetical protein